MSGELVPQARVGRVVAPSGVARPWRAVWIAAGLGAFAWMFTLSAIGGGIALAVAGSIAWLLRRRHARWTRQWRIDFTAFEDAMRAGKLDQADEILIRRERLPMNALGHGVVAFHRGRIFWLRGDLDRALASYGHSRTRVTRTASGYEGIFWQTRVALASLQLELGLLHNAEVSFQRALEAPARYVTPVSRASLELQHAWVHDRADELGDLAALEARLELVRAARQGLPLAVLAWAYAARGDHETAAALRDEARPLLERGKATLARMYPTSWARLAAEVGPAREASAP